MRDPTALKLALDLVRLPLMVRQAKSSPLPRGVTFVLEVAAGEVDAIAAAAAITGWPEPSLREATGFFIEQILLNRQADSYRILGATTDASSSELRRNMALLMRWLHPDVHSGISSGKIDRSVLAHRVTSAWEDLKTDERRASYKSAVASPPMAYRLQNDLAPRQPSRSRRRLVMFRIDGQGLVRRLFQFLRGSR
jgi:DnaJ domain